ISILFFIILCTPCFQIQGVDWQITRRLSYLLYLTIGVLLCFQRKYGASDLKIFNPLIYLSIGVVFTEFCYYAFDVNKSDFALRHSIFRIFEFFLFFLLIYRSRLQFEQLFYILCIGFIGTSVYVFLETFLDFTPYKLAAAGQDNLYSNVEMYQVRAKGLFMHPLILSAFTVIFYTVLLIRTIIMNKPAVFMLILCICTGI